MYTTDYSIDKVCDVDYDIEVHRTNIFDDSSRTYIVQPIARLFCTKNNKHFPLQLLFILLIASMLVGCSSIIASSVPTVEPTSAIEPHPMDVTIAPQSPPSGTLTSELTHQTLPSQQLDSVDDTVSKTKCDGTNFANVDKIVLGALAPLSETETVSAGVAMESAIKIAMDDLNQNNGVLGKPIEVITRDTQGDPQVGASAVEALITEQCVVGLIGVYHSRVALAIKEIAHRLAHPVIFSEPVHDDITKVGHPQVFRIAPAFSMVVESDKRWLTEIGDYNADGHKFIVFIQSDRIMNYSRAESVAQALRTESIETEIFDVDLTTTDFLPLIARIVSLELIPDVIWLHFNNETGYAIHNQLLAAGFGPHKNTLIVTRQSALRAEEFWRRVPSGAYTVISKVGPWHQTVTETGRRFAQTYLDQTGHWPESYAFAAYDSVRLFADALIAALESADVELASGRFSFPYNSNRLPDDVYPEYLWHQWPDAQILFLQYTAPQQSSNEAEVIWPPHLRTTDSSVIRP
ncbi:ABC transporter substrate-binding protein [Chloroflexi bacterium TSY]|nr:ABC transporter substrate-binding protein [Chloroflexi bacterium TSY]